MAYPAGSSVTSGSNCGSLSTTSHESPQLETVVERHETWFVVDKLPQFEPLVTDDPAG